MSFKERVFTAQEEDRVSPIEQRLDSLSSGFRESSRSPARGDGRNMRGDSPADNFRQRNYSDAGYRQRSPSYGRDWRHNDSEGIMSHVIGNPEGALLNSDHSVKIIGVGTLLGGLFKG